MSIFDTGSQTYKTTNKIPGLAGGLATDTHATFFMIP